MLPGLREKQFAPIHDETLLEQMTCSEAESLMSPHDSFIGHLPFPWRFLYSKILATGYQDP